MKNIDDELKSISDEILYIPILNFIRTNLIERGDFHVRVIKDDWGIVLIINIETFKFSFSFWKEGKRVSFFIDEKEILDDYLRTDLDSEACVSFLKTLFSHEIKVERFLFKKNRKEYKSIFQYFINSEGNTKQFNDEQIMRLRLWRDLISEKKSIDKLIKS